MQIDGRAKTATMYYNVAGRHSEKTMSVTSVRLQPDVEQDLEYIVARQQRSKSWLINQALREYVQRQSSEEDRWQQTLEALDNVTAGRVLPAKTVHGWLQSWGGAKEPAPPKVKR
ncbi:MAG: ribbon-helix-helix protein, CopG family [Rhodanobacteraceae bacterium]